MPTRECPECRLLNDDTAKRCDCGYDFSTDQPAKKRLFNERAIRRIVRVWALLLLIPCAGMSILGIGMGTAWPSYSRQLAQAQTRPWDQESPETRLLNRVTHERLQRLAGNAKRLLPMGILCAVVCIGCVGVAWKATDGWASVLGMTAIIALLYVLYLFGLHEKNLIATGTVAPILAATAVIMFSARRQLRRLSRLD